MLGNHQTTINWSLSRVAFGVFGVGIQRIGLRKLPKFALVTFLKDLKISIRTCEGNVGAWITLLAYFEVVL